MTARSWRFAKAVAVGVDVGVVGPVLAIQERLVVALQFVVEDDARDASALALDAGRFLLVDPIQLGVVASSRGFTTPA